MYHQRQVSDGGMLIGMRGKWGQEWRTVGGDGNTLGVVDQVYGLPNIVITSKFSIIKMFCKTLSFKNVSKHFLVNNRQDRRNIFQHPETS